MLALVNHEINGAVVEMFLCEAGMIEKEIIPGCPEWQAAPEQSFGVREGKFIINEVD